MSQELLVAYVAEYRAWLDAHPYKPGDYAEHSMMQDRALSHVRIWFATRTDIHTREEYGYEPADAISRIRADVAAQADAVRRIEEAHRVWFEPAERELAELRHKERITDPAEAYDAAIAELVAAATDEDLAEFHAEVTDRDLAGEVTDEDFAYWILAQKPVPKPPLTTEAMDAAIGLLAAGLDAEHLGEADAERLPLDEAWDAAMDEEGRRNALAYLARTGHPAPGATRRKP